MEATFDVNEETLEVLRLEAERSGVSMSALVESALQMALPQGLFNRHKTEPSPDLSASHCLRCPRGRPSFWLIYPTRRSSIESWTKMKIPTSDDSTDTSLIVHRKTGHSTRTCSSMP